MSELACNIEVTSSTILTVILFSACNETFLHRDTEPVLTGNLLEGCVPAVKEKPVKNPCSLLLSHSDKAQRVTCASEKHQHQFISPQTNVWLTIIKYTFKISHLLPLFHFPHSVAQL